jgi:LysM repeat protein
MRLRDPSRSAARRRSYRRYSAWTFVAPAALLVAVVIVVSVVTDTLDARRKEAAERPTTTAAATTAAAGTTATGPVAKKFHRVKDGESLSSIADDFKTSVDALTELNPNVDPLKLTPGARIRVQ